MTEGGKETHVQPMAWTPTKTPYRALAVRIATAKMATDAAEAARRSVTTRPPSWKATSDLRRTYSRP